MQNRFGLLDTNVIPIFMIIALDIVITLCFSINCSAVICSPTVIFSILREASSGTYGPQVYFPSYKFPIYNFSFRFTSFAIFYFPIYKPKVPKIFTLPFIYLYQISLLRVTMKGLTTPLSSWLQVLDCLCRYLVTCASSPTELIPWLTKLREYLRYFAASSSPLRGNPTQCSRGSNIPWSRMRSIYDI